MPAYAPPVRRVVALLAAAAMVATALYVRSRIDRREEEGTLRLVCSLELAAACEALRQADSRITLTTEEAGTTADRLATAVDNPGLDGWLVPEPWPDIVDGRRRTRTLPALFATSRQPLARSPIRLVVWQDRDKALISSNRCPSQADWKCLGEAAAAGPWTASGGRPEWGPLKLGIADPATDGLGLLVLGHAVSSWFGRTDLALIDLETSDAFDRWLSALGQAVRPSPISPLGRMLATNRAEYDAAGTVEAEVGPLLVNSPRAAEVHLLYPSPMATADVTLATAGSTPEASALGRLATGSVLRKSLVDSGWRVPGEEGVPGVATDPLPPSTGLPPAGLLDALRERWRQVARR